MDWPLLLIAAGLALALLVGFDIWGVATRLAGWNDPITRNVWMRLPAPWSHVTHPSYWRIVGVELGAILVVLGVLFMAVGQR
jgi:hypothetical protein